MSEKKQIINVKDLVIKADNVYLEPDHDRKRRGDWDQGHVRGRDEERDHERKRHEHDREEDHRRHDQEDERREHDRNRNHDPFFGFFGGRRNEEESSDHGHEHKMESSEEKRGRGPFSWL
ncbi:hypothetical protein CIL03_05570 [Virgibacillus indicus]|uniref:Uncharacterized protein n=1 Tax=Virgibacillus indicus TaxID=2024554 RepID=A0A265NH80_9BACI|nr:hypothetical protein [Virgibacillus indicus]OZU90606.1 hypothetical protein CIL03_05570 [Virgibacillus indicus]